MMTGFIQGSAGPCFASLYIPKIPPAGWVLCFPPFAEEMNKSRKIMSTQAREMASKGLLVVVPDLYGTGDSGGDFSDADWNLWLGDMFGLLDWIREQGAKEIYFWGIRLGCLLALDLYQQLEKKISGILLWQPIANGQQAMTQFLRLRMAASIMAGAQEKVSDLRKRLLDEGQLEVAGYKVSARLVSQIDRLSMQNMTPEQGLQVSWFEISTNSEKPLPVVSRKIVDDWHQAGVVIKAEMVEGESFWMTQETSTAPALIQRTTEVLSRGIQTRKDTLAVNWKHPQLSSSIYEYSTSFICHGETLPAIVHPGDSKAKRGILIVVGGPQYRVGSHRHFVLLARDLAAKGVPVFRFDYRGMGDASGRLTGFEAIHDDIRMAVDCFQSACPALSEVVIWGLCDAATAAAFYAADDSRIQGLVLLNPWVRSEEGEAKTYIRHYYLQRLLSQDFWRKVFSGRFQALSSLKSFVELFGKAIGTGTGNSAQSGNDPVQEPTDSPLAFRMEKALERFNGKVLLILSGNDLTAAEFNLAIIASTGFQKIVKRKGYRVKKLEDADHTFSKSIWRDKVTLETVNWLKSW